ncbi:hypothetical protein COV19_02480 [Candidatus Woesearchaeota archaeon CG10_big_fil_rev_8_21_14_0_10_44_13]|nr:MAG: hypothetical protein COV19_02480 [Candidatus Woesearchaeota archaeon CG10_big_fil_rev_8_21_14_0_10_44_13]
MEIRKETDFLEKSRQFADWRRKNKDNYLSYILFISGEKEDKLEMGYHNKKNDKVTTFCITNCGKKERGIEIRPEENVFKKPDMDVKKLEMDTVKIDVGEALAIAQKLQKEKYPAEAPIKIVLILQNLDPYGQIYNLTYVTKCFKTLNLKIDSETGDVVEEDLVSLMQMGGKEAK